MSQHATTPLCKQRRALIACAAFVFLSACLRMAAVEAKPGLAAFASASLSFEQNCGQFDEAISFVARGASCEFLVSPTEAVLTLSKFKPAPRRPEFPGDGSTSTAEAEVRSVRLQFLGANPKARVAGAGEVAGSANYLLGSDSARWRVGVPAFERVCVEGIYPGINLVHYGNQQKLEYDFVVSPHADPSLITVRFSGADSVSVDSQGELVLNVAGAEVRQPRPLIYQTVRGVRKEISGGYRLVDAVTMKFEIGSYDTSLPLVIDPILSYSTYFGGSASDTAWAIAVGKDGDVFIAGETMSSQLASSGAAQTNLAGVTSVRGDAFIARYDNYFSIRRYVTYLGGRTDDAALGLAVDDEGKVYVTGYTDSTNFPTLNTIYTNISGAVYPGVGLHPQDAFVSVISASGSNLLYSTYLGGNFFDEGIGIALDAATNIHVSGYTESTNFPTWNTTRTNYGGGGDGFVVKIGPGFGSNFIYSMFLGGTNLDTINDIAADATGSAYITGHSASTNFPIVNAAQSLLNNQTNVNASADVIAAKISPSGDSLVYSTFLGGTNADYGYRLSLAADNSVFITGATFSPDFFRTTTNLQSSVASNVTTTSDVFAVKLDGSGARVYSLMFGGSLTDQGWDVAVDGSGKAHIVGVTASRNFPTNQPLGLLRGTNMGGNDVFVAEINSNGTALVHSAYLGGSGEDFGYGIAVDAGGNSYLAGETASANFPIYNATNPTLRGSRDAFVAKVVSEPVLSISKSGTNVVVSWPGITTDGIYKTDFDLQSNSSLTNTTGWVSTAKYPVPTNGVHTALFPIQTNQLFFRLKTYP